MGDDETVLELRPLFWMTNASREMARYRQEGRRRFVPAVFRPSSQGCLPYRVIPDGFSAVVSSYGECIGIWPPGIHFCGPWIQVEFLVPYRHLVFASPVKECPTADNVMVNIDITLVLKITRDDQSIIKFCYELGPSRLNSMIEAFQEEAIRTMARNKNYYEIYDLMDTAVEGQLENTKRMMNARLKDYGVVITNMTITNVTLPLDIAKTMEQETTYESLNRYQHVKQDFELLCLDNREVILKTKQQIREDLLEEQTQSEKQKAAAQLELDLVLADTEKIVAEINEKQISEVREMNSTAKLKVAQLNGEKIIELSKLESDGSATAQKIITEAEADNGQEKAVAQKIISENEAKARFELSAAEDKAAVALKSKREFDRKMRHLKILKGLAGNDKVSLTGNRGDSAVSQFLATKGSAPFVGLHA